MFYITQLYFYSRKMALAAAATLTLQNCFAVLWRRLRKVFVCVQPDAEQQQPRQHENEQEESDGAGGHPVRVENFISCCGGRAVNVGQVEPYSRKEITEASVTQPEKTERSGLFEYALRLKVLFYEKAFTIFNYFCIVIVVQVRRRGRCYRSPNAGVDAE